MPCLVPLTFSTCPLWCYLTSLSPVVGKARTQERLPGCLASMTCRAGRKGTPGEAGVLAGSLDVPLRCPARSRLSHESPSPSPFPSRKAARAPRPQAERNAQAVREVRWLWESFRVLVMGMRGPGACFGGRQGFLQVRRAPRLWAGVEGALCHIPFPEAPGAAVPGGDSPLRRLRNPGALGLARRLGRRSSQV